MSLRKSAPTPVSGTSSGNSRVRVSGSVAAGRRSSWVGVGVAHLADLLSLADLLPFLDQNLAVVRVSGKVGVVVLDDDHLAVAAQARSGVDDSTGSTGQYRLT